MPLPPQPFPIAVLCTLYCHFICLTFPRALNTPCPFATTANHHHCHHQTIFPLEPMGMNNWITTQIDWLGLFQNSIWNPSSLQPTYRLWLNCYIHRHHSGVSHYHLISTPRKPDPRHLSIRAVLNVYCLFFGYTLVCIGQFKFSIKYFTVVMINSVIRSWPSKLYVWLAVVSWLFPFTLMWYIITIMSSAAISKLTMLYITKHNELHFIPHHITDSQT